MKIMNATKTITLTTIILTASTLASCAELDDVEVVALEQEAINGTVEYLVRGDLRQCREPICGGFLVEEVGASSTTCADGTRVVDRSCAVSTFDWGALRLRPADEEELDLAARAGRITVVGIVEGDRRSVASLLVTDFYPNANGWLPNPTGWYPRPDGWCPDVDGWYPDIDGWHPAETGY